jgi:hypothetical protein
MTKKKIIGKMLLVLSLLSSAVMLNPSYACGEISFIVPIDRSLFSENKTINVKIYTMPSTSKDNSDTRSALQEKKEQDCYISHGEGKKPEKVSCKSLDIYELSEEFQYPIKTLDSRIKINSQSVKLGHPYRIIISGLSKDNCNTASLSKTDVAHFREISLSPFSWTTTRLGCPSETQPNTFTVTTSPDWLLNTRRPQPKNSELFAQ